MRWHTQSQTARLMAMMIAGHIEKIEAAKRAGKRMVGGLYRRTRPTKDGGKVSRWEIRFDGLAGCLRVPTGGSSRQTVMIVEGDKVRSRLLSPREAARLMGLPDDYVLPANVNEALGLIGDGVVVPVVRFLAENILEPILAANESNPQSAGADIPPPILAAPSAIEPIAAHGSERLSKDEDAQQTTPVVRPMERKQRVIEKRERRRAREAELGARQRALPDKRYGVIYGDPAWRFEPYSRETGMDRAADNHYATSELETIKALDIASIAAKDCVLFLWATVPMLPQAFEVMAAWGFTYKSSFVWVKDRVGTGYWSRNRHELLLIGTLGNIPAPAPGAQYPSAIEAPIGRHSEKPPAFHEIIERYFPTLPKVELYARNARLGWDVWGLEAPTDIEKEQAVYDAAWEEIEQLLCAAEGANEIEAGIDAHIDQGANS